MNVFEDNPDKAGNNSTLDGDVKSVSNKDVFTSEYVIYDDNDFDRVYLSKSKIITDAIDKIGFGKYQIGLFFISGFGWFSDNAWPIAVGLILSRLNEVDGVHAPTGKAPFITLAQNLGLLAGAFFWSLSSDLIGRRWAFNITLLTTGVFSTISGSSPNFAALGVYAALWSFGVGGNMPVDTAVFLESIPSNKQYFLTILSVFWAFGQLVANLFSWALISNFSCDDAEKVCYKSDNQGWRYFLYTLGGFTLLLFIIRFSIKNYESPKFLLAVGKDEKAVEVVHKIAKINGKPCFLTIESLREVDDSESSSYVPPASNELLKDKIKKYNFSHIRECFASRKMAMSTIMVIVSWALIGLAFPLYNAFLPTFLEKRGNANKPLSVRETYRNSLIVAVMGIPGSLIAGLLVELRIGRKGALCLSLLLTGVFLFCSTTARTSNANLGWNCMFNLFSTMMYGILYAYTPEIFPARIRGTAVGIASSANRVLGVFAPVIGIYANLDTPVPIYVSGALFLVVGVISLFLPYESKGRKSL
ncbi:Piso0_003671 [Millerozyma farinosa CBS 7064]|uniref:Piso0_003671 protein n=1 Tax=Pichia sorbitophila (strain ATCC MYA-4447 / BCRC 22081 / CBS 7064 / NBRC 10061 / NRRL Y-12695) TaxID=559304 RepID=G8YJQ7_PICSO|nr:Piso0_003671 [Millerozyma farinosa CBS 7064]CCE81317.1 Piso0_003671 [Millerozyma farinosa CBS 7064]